MIQILSEQLINKIAAGEVIVRPASVVKELVENAIDASARRIRIEIGNGCRDIAVADDGAGIAREDAPLALVRHATSKIAAFDDLWSLTTRGFRGEALASIAAVSRLELRTRRAPDDAGVRVVSEGGREPTIESAGLPPGTEVRIRDLFFNTPARLKFLKNPSAELQHALSVITRQALVHPEIGFTVQGERGLLFQVPPGQAWADRITELLGSQVEGNLLEVDASRHGIEWRGFVVKPLASRKDRRGQHFSVNRRPITSRSLSGVLQQAYHGFIMVQRYPMAVLDVTVAPGEVDVNVHPTKEEVRFRQESAVNGALYHAVTSRLRAANLVPTADLGTGAATSSGPSPTGGVTMPFDFTPMTQPSLPLPGAGSAPQQREFLSLARQAQSAADTGADTDIAQVVLAAGLVDAPFHADEGPECDVRPLDASAGHAPVSDTGTALDPATLPEPLGQVDLCYIAAQAGHDLLLVDQHAAHERLQYLRLSAALASTARQPLLVPVSIDVPAPMLGFMESLLPVLAELGLETEHFGGCTFIVNSVPADLPRLDAAAVIADLLDDFEALGRLEQVDILRDRVVTRMACRSAIKAGQRLSMEEMRALLREIVTARLGFTCPHGRPTMILLTRDQLDRQFRRRV